MLHSRRLVGLLVIWGAATAFGLAVAEGTKIGPVLVTLFRGHGIHLGDLVAFFLAYAGAGALTVWTLRRS